MKEHYDFSKYVDLGRWNSYYIQIESVCKYDSGKGRKDEILLIGVGDGIVVEVLKSLGKKVTTFDFDKELDPDIVGDVTKIDVIVNKKYDVVVCCQVLEHIPFEMFEKTIEKLGRVTNNLVLSLPNRNIWFKRWTYCPILRNIMWKLKLRMVWKKTWDIKTDGNGEHYREIDAKPEWRKKNIEKILDKYFKIEDYYVPFNNTYHMFRRLSGK